MIENILNTPIEDLSLSTRTYSCLKRAGYYTVGKLVEATADELLMLPSFGKKCFNEIVAKLDSLGLCLKEKNTPQDKKIEVKPALKRYADKQTEKWVTTEDVANHLGISLRTAHLWIKAGKLPAYLVRGKYRFKISEVDEWLRAGKMADD